MTDLQSVEPELGLQSGTVIGKEYTLIKMVGKGSSGEVWEAHTKNQGSVAIKVMKLTGRTRETKRAWAFSEILAKSNESATKLFTRVLACKSYKRHQALVYPLYGMSLAKLIDSHHMMPLPMHHFRTISWQLMKAVEFLHSLRIAHTDLKPDNIVLIDHSIIHATNLNNEGEFVTKSVLRNPQIKLIDLDDSRTMTSPMREFIGTLQYRAPEVSSGLPWTFSTDIFSVGCTIYELFKGDLPFPDTENIAILLAYIEKKVGRFSYEFAEEISGYSTSLFTSKYPVAVILPEPASEKDEAQIRGLKNVFSIDQDIRDLDLAELIRRCLNPDPRGRITAADAVIHPFFDCILPNEATNYL